MRHKIKRIKPIRRKYIAATDDQRLQILRFLAKDRLTYTEIAKRTGLRRQNIINMHRSFKKYRTHVRYKKGLSGRKPIAMPEDVEKYLLSSLNLHQFLSIASRCALVKEKFDFHVSTIKLRHFFYRHGIRHSRVKSVMRAASEENQSKLAERADFARKVVTAMAQKRRIIWADETSYRINDR